MTFQYLCTIYGVKLTLSTRIFYHLKILQLIKTKCHEKNVCANFQKYRVDFKNLGHYCWFLSNQKQAGIHPLLTCHNIYYNKCCKSGEIQKELTSTVILYGRLIRNTFYVDLIIKGICLTLC